MWKSYEFAIGMDTKIHKMYKLFILLQIGIKLLLTQMAIYHNISYFSCTRHVNCRILPFESIAGMKMWYLVFIDILVFSLCQLIYKWCVDSSSDFEVALCESFNSCVSRLY